MQLRTLGRSLQVSALGLGCMGMSEFYGPRDDEQSLQTLNWAVDHGVNFSTPLTAMAITTTKSCWRNFCVVARNA
jgi:predicted aldo/keto reductase-like oxidoreductase